MPIEKSPKRRAINYTLAASKLRERLANDTSLLRDNLKYKKHFVHSLCPHSTMNLAVKNNSLRNQGNSICVGNRDSPHVKQKGFDLWPDQQHMYEATILPAVEIAYTIHSCYRSVILLSIGQFLPWNWLGSNRVSCSRRYQQWTYLLKLPVISTVNYGCTINCAEAFAWFHFL